MDPPTLELSGWLLLTISWSVIGATLIFCLARLLKNGRS